MREDGIKMHNSHEQGTSSAAGKESLVFQYRGLELHPLGLITLFGAFASWIIPFDQLGDLGVLLAAVMTIGLLGAVGYALQRFLRSKKASWPIKHFAIYYVALLLVAAHLVVR